MRVTIADLERRIQANQKHLLKDWVQRNPRFKRELEAEIARYRRQITAMRTRAVQKKGSEATKARKTKIIKSMR